MGIRVFAVANKPFVPIAQRVPGCHPLTYNRITPKFGVVLLFSPFLRFGYIYGVSCPIDIIDAALRICTFSLRL
jgi:hypothetical protein